MWLELLPSIKARRRPVCTLAVCCCRWRKLLKSFYNEKKQQFDISKVPDIYDSAKYDAIHNSHLQLGPLKVGADTAALGGTGGNTPVRWALLMAPHLAADHNARSSFRSALVSGLARMCTIHCHVQCQACFRWCT